MSKNSQHFSPTTSKSCRFSPQCRTQRLSWDGSHCRTQDPKGAVGSRSNSSHLIDLNLLVTTPWSLNPPIPTSKPTNLHPLNVDPTPPPGSLFCSEGLSKGLLHRNQLCLREGRFKFSRVCLRNKWVGIDILMFHFDLTLKQLKIHFKNYSFSWLGVSTLSFERQ